MPVIAVVNRKGGSGKSTLAAHIAAWAARRGSSVMLGDVDRQQSARAWLKRRDPGLPVIAPWAVDQKNMLRVPTGITHVVLDTPGGMHGFELARVVMFADAIVMPVCNSMFDRESAEACHAELMTLPRVASGRCRLVTVGMRIDGRTHAAKNLQEWSEGLGIPFLGALRETQLYVKSLERGMTIFDLPPQIAATDLLQWESILGWLEPQLYPPQAANDSLTAGAGSLAAPSAPAARPVQAVPRAVTPAPASPGTFRPAQPDSSRLGRSLPSSLMPAQESMVHGGRLSVLGAGRLSSAPVVSSGKPAMTRNVNSTDGLQIPQFLKRAPH
ncbi:division plane positioning ATPase MipZ [Polaromonas sp.]|uniref:nucleotide-binding protein n=1 Tax=Polaromonas sp. TaxID=1869339 RepID=UPI003BADA521